MYRLGTRLALGNALAGRLLQSAVDAGVTLWSDVRATKIFQDADGAVIGLEIERDGRLQTVRARRGVVLATGGFHGNRDLKQDQVPSQASTIRWRPRAKAAQAPTPALKRGG